MLHAPPPRPVHVAATPPLAPPPGVRVGLIQAVIDGLFEAACVVDGDSLQLLACNEAASALFGAGPDGLIGLQAQDLADTPEEHVFWMGVQSSVCAGIASTDSAQTLHSESLLKRADGELRPVERRIVPIELPSGHPAWLMTWVDLSPREKLERELDRLAGELGATLESSTDAILVTDTEGAVRGCNRAYLRLFRLNDGTSPLDDAVPAALHAQVIDAQGLADFMGELRGDPRRSAVRQLTLRDGRVLEHRTLPQYARGEAIGHIHSLRDLTEHLASQARLRMVADVFETLSDAIFVLDEVGTIVETNRAARQLAGADASALHGLALANQMIAPHDAARVDEAVEGVLQTGRWDGEMVWQTPNGHTPVQVQLIALTASTLATGRYVVIARDLSEHKAQQHALHRLSHTDPLTGLANRALLRDRLEGQLAHHPREEPSFVVLSIGLDRFKHIASALGHRVADRVLIEAGRRLSDCVRQDDLVAHLGSGNFAMLLARGDAAAAKRVAQRVLESLAAEISIDELNFNVGASIGAAICPIDGHSVDDLLANADNALQEVQAAGQGALRFYQPRMNSELLAKVQIDHAMRAGLRANRFYLHYQPQVSLENGTLVGAEALLRWSDPVHGEVSPARFIPVAEETGFISELGDFVLREAVSQTATWLARGLRVPVAVNISALQFQQPHFVDRVLEVLAENGLPGEMLELELTESILLGDMSTILAQLHELARQGVRLAIDDFGTGYSSLGYLKRLPIDRLKIDRSFVKDLPGDASDAAIVRSVVDMARALELTVIAEGVETAEQRDHLAAMGCHEAQGYLYARPLSMQDFERRYAPPVRPIHDPSRRAAA